MPRFFNTLFGQFRRRLHVDSQGLYHVDGAAVGRNGPRGMPHHVKPAGGSDNRRAAADVEGLERVRARTAIVDQRLRGVSTVTLMVSYS